MVREDYNHEIVVHNWNWDDSVLRRFGPNEKEEALDYRDEYRTSHYRDLGQDYGEEWVARARSRIIVREEISFTAEDGWSVLRSRLIERET